MRRRRLSAQELSLHLSEIAGYDACPECYADQLEGTFVAPRCWRVRLPDDDGTQDATYLLDVLVVRGLA